VRGSVRGKDSNPWYAFDNVLHGASDLLVQDAFAGKEGAQAGASFPPKPFTPAALVERVRALIDGRRMGDGP
jgi:hypothetical protein